MLTIPLRPSTSDRPIAALLPQPFHMTNSKKAVAILNPQAASGKTKRVWSRIAKDLERKLGSPVDARFTEHAGHASTLARDALQEGANLIIAVGGDGTVNEVANGFLHDDQPINPAAQLGFIPIGTGSDLRRTLGLPTNGEQAAQIVATGTPFAIDVGKVRLVGRDRQPVERYFVNLVSFGMGGDVSVRAKNFLRPLGGQIAFLYATLAVFFSYHGKRVRLTMDGKPHPDEFFISNIAVGNGCYHGGGMHPCPEAVMNDGWLDVTTIDHLTMYQLIRDLRILYSNNIYQHAKVKHFRARHLRAESDETTRVEVDGEALGKLPLEISLLPRKLPILVAPDSPVLAEQRRQAG